MEITFRRDKCGDRVTAIRIDPGNGAGGGQFAVDYIRPKAK